MLTAQKNWHQMMHLTYSDNGVQTASYFNKPHTTFCRAIAGHEDTSRQKRAPYTLIWLS